MKRKLTFFKTNKMRLPFLGAAIFFLCLSFLTFSCKKNELTGLGVQPGTEELGVITSDSSTIKGFSHRDTSVISTDLINILLGSYQDPVFGKSKAEIFTNVVRPESNINFGELDSLKLDSAVLALEVEEYYGDQTPQNFLVYEMTEAMEEEKVYYSNEKFDYKSTTIGELQNYKASLSDIQVSGNTQSPQVRILLDSTFGAKFLFDPSLDYSSDESLRSFFKGFYITPDNPVQTTGEGAILKIDPTGSYSRFILYYTYKDAVTDNFKSSSFTLPINQNATRVNSFEFDYTGSEVQSEFNSYERGEEFIYLQSMGGVIATLEFPHLKDYYRDHKAVAVNKAELVFPVADNPALYPPHSRITVAAIDDDGSPLLIKDANPAYESADHMGGTYDTDSNQYRLNITRHMQEVFNTFKDGSEKTTKLYVMPVGKATTANRTILFGTGSSAKKAKLVLSFTPL